MTEHKDVKPEGPTGDPWRYRRRYMFGYVIFNLGTILWLLVTGNDSALAQSFTTLSLPTTGVVIGTYIFGAAWLDKR